MRLPPLDATWPESWKLSWEYDQREQVGLPRRRAYQYGYRTRSATLVDAVRSHCPAGGRVLDVGAGQGSISLQLAEAGFEVTWNDLRSELADYVKLKYEYGTLHYRPGNIFDDHVPDRDRFDAVLAAEVIEHVAHPDDFLARLATLLAPGGTLVLSTPNGRNLVSRLPTLSEIDDPSAHEHEQFKPDADGHIFLLTPSELRQLAALAGLRVIRLRLLQTYVAHAAERVVPKLLSFPQVLRLVAALDRQVLRVPRVNEWLAVQMVAVLERDRPRTARVVTG